LIATGEKLIFAFVSNFVSSFVLPMKFLSRPGFYVILLLIAAMLLLTMYLQWKLDSLPKHKAKQETAPAAVSHPP
jgi:magnesium-transporting ATPase (P-type)